VLVVTLLIAQSRKQKKRASMRKSIRPKKHQKRGYKAHFLALEGQFDQKIEYLVRTRSSRSSTSSRTQKGEQPFLCLVLDLGMDDNATTSDNSANHDLPKIQRFLVKMNFLT
jgi:hypothetical protein